MLWIFLNTYMYIHSESCKKCSSYWLKLLGYNMMGTCQYLVEISDVTVAKPLSKHHVNSSVYGSELRSVHLCFISTCANQHSGKTTRCSPNFITYCLNWSNLLNLSGLLFLHLSNKNHHDPSHCHVRLLFQRGVL